MVLAGRAGSQRLVTAASRAALALGVRTGMPVSRARAVAPELRVAPADAAADRQGLERLALWLEQRVAPVVAVDWPDGIVIDATGSAHLHGGEAALLQRLIGRLAAAGITARAAIADSWGAAHALARFGKAPLFVAEVGNVLPLLAPLPLAALRLPPALVAELDQLGLASIGDLAAAPRAPIARRFGALPALRLDQALGRVAEPICRIRPRAPVCARRAFAEPIAAPEAIAREIRRLVAAVCAALAARAAGARRLDLQCVRIDGAVERARIGLARPRRDPARLAQLLCDGIERLDPGLGIEAMTLTVSWAEPLAPRQLATDLAEVPAPDLSALVDSLGNRLGAARVYRHAPVASDVPERSVRRVPALAPAGGDDWPSDWPRPARLLPRPEAIRTLALLPDYPPAWFVWRGVRHRVARADGPERIFGEWWVRDSELAAVRDYFRVEDMAGARFWIFRAGDGVDPATGAQRWFLHGLFG